MCAELVFVQNFSIKSANNRRNLLQLITSNEIILYNVRRFLCPLEVTSLAANQTSESTIAIPAKKRTVKKKVGKTRVVRKKRVAAQVPASAQAQSLIEQASKAKAAADTAKERIAELQVKIKDARSKLKATGDGRARRTINSGAEKLEALREKASEATAKLRSINAELSAQAKEDATEAKRDAALAAALENFKAQWLKAYTRKAKAKARAKRVTRGAGRRKAAASPA